MFIWEDEAKDFKEHDNKVESEVGALAIEVVEGLKKKNGKLKLKLIAKRSEKKIIMVLLVLFVIVNMLLVLVYFSLFMVVSFCFKAKLLMF